MTKNLSLLGSTGSIGTQSLDVARKRGYRVRALSAFSNVKKIEEQIREFKPDVAALVSEDAAKDLKVRVADTGTKILSGSEGVCECAAYDKSDTVLNSVVGMAGLEPTLTAIKAHKKLALANKETLVAGGRLVMDTAERENVDILPVDSEHSAIFQALQGKPSNRALKKIILTASGGPFFGRTAQELEKVTVNDALKHPNWSMGQKITIDSASMVNKGLEVMEAKWLFGTDLDQIQVVIQPQSVIHSMVQFVDGAVIAQLGTPDMKLPIQYALYYPERRYLGGERLDFAKLGKITFEDPDPETFLGLKYAFYAARIGGSMPTVFNAANERAVSKFLNRKIGFTDIYEIIRYCMDAHQTIADPDIRQILDTEQSVYELIESRW